MKTDKDQNQGKQGTAETDATYKRDAENLKNSSTTSQHSATSPGNVGAGGIAPRMDQDAEEERKETK